jgi:hypothetical protein
LKNSDLISGIKEINNEISTTNFVQVLMTEKREARIRERQLSGIAREVTRRFKAKKLEISGDPPPKQRKSRRRQDQQAIKELNFQEMKTIPEERESLIKKIDFILNQPLEDLHKPDEEITKTDLKMKEPEPPLEEIKEMELEDDSNLFNEEPEPVIELSRNPLEEHHTVWVKFK